MLRALLEELLSKLTALAEEGHTGTIDLRGLPLPPGTLDALRSWLGEGEIRATVNALGTTTIEETAFAGLWWVRHAKAQGRPIGDALEITYCPALLLPDRDAVQGSAIELRRKMDSLSGSPPTSTSAAGSADPG